MASKGRPRLYPCECDWLPMACAVCVADKGATARRLRRLGWEATKQDPVKLERHRRQSREAGRRQRQMRADARAAGC